MSLDATSWAWRQDVQNSSQRVILLSLADRAGEDHTCWPSVDRLAKDTRLNRKTVLKVLKDLVGMGLIQDTGERKGKTRQVRCYALIGVVGRELAANSTKSGTLNESNSTNTGTLQSGGKSPKTGTVKESQKRNSTENGTVPNFPDNSPKSGLSNSPKNGTQNQPLEPTNNQVTSEPDRPDASSGDLLPGSETNRPDAAIESGALWGTGEDLMLAEWMWAALAQQLGADSPRKPNLARWANAIRLMRVQDNRTPKHIKALYAWCRQHPFWSANVQSPEKLREKWPQLASQRNQEIKHAAGESAGNPSGLGRQLTDISYGVSNW